MKAIAWIGLTALMLFGMMACGNDCATGLDVDGDAADQDMTDGEPADGDASDAESEGDRTDETTDGDGDRESLPGEEESPDGEGADGESEDAVPDGDGSEEDLSDGDTDGDPAEGEDAEEEASELCDGCFIAGECVPDGAVNSENGCLVCRVEDAANAWTAAVGTECLDNDLCTLNDACTDQGTCVGVLNTCNGQSACDPSDGHCECGDDWLGDQCETPRLACQDGICTDAATLVSWMENAAEGTFTFPEAESFCAGLDLMGGSWRLPVIDQLRTLIRRCPATMPDGSCNVRDNGCLIFSCYDQSCNGCEFSETGYLVSSLHGATENPRYWSRTPVLDQMNQMWSLAFNVAGLTPAGSSRDERIMVRCVRPAPRTPCDAGDPCLVGSVYNDMGECLEGTPYSCHEHGTCRGDAYCQCDPGWDGPTCETPVCSPACVHGTCVGPDSCDCDDGWQGDACEQPICLSGCQNGGVCTAPDTCVCSDGWEGPACEQPICEPECENGGFCTTPDRCECPIDWEGDRCETPRMDCDYYVCVDLRTGLRWQRNSNNTEFGEQKKGISEARTYCDTLTLGGSDQWRLPTIGELRTLLRGCSATITGGSCGVTDSCLDFQTCLNEYGEGGGQCEGCEPMAGPNYGGYGPSELVGNCTSYWSNSVPGTAPTYLYVIDFLSGELTWTSPEHGFIHQVRCVY